MASSKVQRASCEVLNKLNEVSDPSRMSASEYRELLEELIEDLEARRDAVVVET